jgi:DNA-binding beta-propeller fold protein YncE
MNKLGSASPHLSINRLAACCALACTLLADAGSATAAPVVVPEDAHFFTPPARDLPASRDTVIDGNHVAVLPNGRFITPAGIEVPLDAPKPFTLDVSRDGKTAITVNSGSSRFSVSLIRNLDTANPVAVRIPLDATFLGVVLSPDGKRFYVSGGDNSVVLVGDVAAGRIIASVNLNGSAHPITAPFDVTHRPGGRFKGAFPGAMALSTDGRWLYVVDQAAFAVHAIDTTRVVTGIDSSGSVVEPNNFAALASSTTVGRYPFGIAIAPGGKQLVVTHVGLFQYTHLRPANPTGDSNIDYPLCYPGTSFPDDMAKDKTIRISKIDPNQLDGLPAQDPRGVRCGYVAADQDYTIPGLGSPNVPEASSTYLMSLADPAHPVLSKVVKTGPAVGELDHGVAAYGGSHPNAVAFGKRYAYVANGNNDTISVVDPRAGTELQRISLTSLQGYDAQLKGLQPMSLAVSPDGSTLYAALPGINAIAVVALDGIQGELKGLIPTAWYPSSVRVSPDGRQLYVANARGHGSGPNNSVPPDNLGSPKYSTLGSVSVIAVPREAVLDEYTRQVLRNNGLNRPESVEASAGFPIPGHTGQASRQIRHVIFVNKENLTHDLVLGDITSTRQGISVEGDPAYSMGYAAAPNHHELALGFAFSDNFYLEPSVSSDGHRWLTNTYNTEFEETHWPASYGGRRGDAGDDPAVYGPYPGRLGFTDANGSPAPEDYNQHGSIFEHLERFGRSYFNFGNGYEFAEVDEDDATAPTGIRQHVNVPMQTTWRAHSDHLFPEFNTGIPDAPQPGGAALGSNPGTFSRFGRFQQVFEQQFVDRSTGECKLPNYTDLYYPNDHGGGSFGWSYTRYLQDNDAALGLTVDLISHSPCWKDTVIFVVEDDAQNGFDHVDGNRSLFLAISPWVKHEYVLKKHVSLESVFKTADQILGLPPLNLYEATAADLRDLFTDKPDFTPYTFASILYAEGPNAVWTQLASSLDFSKPDSDLVSIRAAIAASEHIPHVDQKHKPWRKDPKADAGGTD